MSLEEPGCLLNGNLDGGYVLGRREKLCYNKDFGNCISKSTWPKIYMQNMD